MINETNAWKGQCKKKTSITLWKQKGMSEEEEAKLKAEALRLVARVKYGSTNAIACVIIAGFIAILVSVLLCL